MQPSRAPRTVTPIYEHGDVGSQSRRRLLALSYYFPPQRAVGALRWEKLSHFAAERGWGLDVIACGAGGKVIDDPRLRALPSGVRLYAVEVPEITLARLERSAAAIVRDWRRAVPSHADTTGPSTMPPADTGSVASEDIRWSLTSARGLLRLGWAWLDHAKGRAWGRAAARTGIALVQPGVHRAVVASSPPFMAMEGARLVSRATGIPLVLDMRDLWRDCERLTEAVATPLWLRIAGLYERRAVEQAALTIANTEVARRALAARYPSRADDIIAVTNGSDEDPLPCAQDRQRFVIAHLGTVYLDRNPRGLLVAAGHVIRDLALSPAEFGLSFVGDLDAVGGYPILEVARQEGISEYVETSPPVSHSEAMQRMARASMLVTMSGSNQAAIPAKTFECIRFPSWVLALSARGSATQLLLEGTDADVVEPSDVESISAVIRQRFSQFRNGVVPAPVGSHPRFSRRYQARILFDAIEARTLDAQPEVPLSVAPAQQTVGPHRDEPATMPLRRLLQG